MVNHTNEQSRASTYFIMEMKCLRHSNFPALSSLCARLAMLCVGVWSLHRENHPQSRDIINKFPLFCSVIPPCAHFCRFSARRPHSKALNSLAASGGEKSSVHCFLCVQRAPLLFFPHSQHDFYFSIYFSSLSLFRLFAFVRHQKNFSPADDAAALPLHSELTTKTRRKSSRRKRRASERERRKREEKSCENEKFSCYFFSFMSSQRVHVGGNFQSRRELFAVAEALLSLSISTLRWCE